MSEESTTPDLVVLTRRWFEAANRRDVDAAASFYAPDAVHESVGMGASVEGTAAIREYLGDFVGAYDEFSVEAEEILDLGNGVTLDVVNQKGRPHGSSGEVQMRYAAVAIWVEGMIERFTTYTNIDEGRPPPNALPRNGDRRCRRNVELIRRSVRAIRSSRATGVATGASGTHSAQLPWRGPRCPGRGAGPGRRTPGPATR